MPRFLAISGSLRAASTNSQLIEAMARLAPAGIEVDVYAGLGGLPIFNPDDEGDRTPPSAHALIEAVGLADGVIFACPEYAHGVPGGLKNGLDWLVSRDVPVGKPAMLVHASHRSLFARSALSEILRTMSFDLFSEPELEIPLIGKTAQDACEILARPDNAERMHVALVSFADFVSRLRESNT